MEIRDLIDVALSNVDERKVELAILEPAEVLPQGVPALGTIASDLLGHIGGAQTSDTSCRVAASWDGDDYLITISWAGPDLAIDVLDQLLQDIELPLAMASIARVAKSHGIGMRFVPGPDAVTAQIQVPSSIVTRSETPNTMIVPEPVEDTFIPHEMDRRVQVPAGSWLDESEAFLERVFAPLRLTRVPFSERGEDVVLQVRVPGEKFTEPGDDSPSTMAAEAAVEIRSALSTYDRGRRSAELAG
jgi:hypothetical protein